MRVTYDAVKKQAHECGLSVRCVGNRIELSLGNEGDITILCNTADDAWSTIYHYKRHGELDVVQSAEYETFS